MSSLLLYIYCFILFFKFRSALSRPIKTEVESEEDEAKHDGWSSPEEGEISPQKPCK
jgi:hypothetical protein